MVTDFLKEAYAILCDMGCDVQFEDKASVPDKEKQEGRKIRKEKFVEAVKTAKVISPDKYKAKKKRPESPDDSVSEAETSGNKNPDLFRRL